ncbi:MAG: hypothetical protein LBT86_08905 [Deltaproteobacteria bacterium]|nr:hypothetical protein [Deltaproteobacteria bacterium]
MILAPLKRNRFTRFVVEQQHASYKKVNKRLFETWIRLRAASTDEELEFVAIHTGDPKSPLDAKCSPERGVFLEAHDKWGSHFYFPILTVLSLSLDELRKDPRPFSLILLAWVLLFKYGDATEEARERGYKEVFDRARELNLDHDRYAYIYRFIWSIFVVYGKSAFAKKIEDKYLMLIMTSDEFQRAYPEALISKYQWETSVKIAKRLLRRGYPIDEVIEVTDLSRKEVAALKAKLKAGSKKASPAPAAS